MGALDRVIMIQRTYTAEFKKVAIQKIFINKNRKLPDIAKEIGVPRSTLYVWVKEYKKCGNNLVMNNTQKRPQDWTPNEKIKACFDYDNLPQHQQGEFLRRNGLHSSHLTEWKKLCINALSSRTNDNVSKSELRSAHQKIKELEQDLLRKERALAETTSLLILKKKADLIFGSEAQKSV